jgi:hypothetical protein
MGRLTPPASRSERRLECLAGRGGGSGGGHMVGGGSEEAGVLGG